MVLRKYLEQGLEAFLCRTLLKAFLFLRAQVPRFLSRLNLVEYTLEFDGGAEGGHAAEKESIHTVWFMMMFRGESEDARFTENMIFPLHVV